MKLNKFIFASFLSLLPLQQVSIFASELLATGNDSIEEIKVKRVKKNGNLVVKFCNSLSDYSGFVEVQGQKFLVSKAEVLKDGKKLVWKDTNLSKTKGDSINTDNLLSDGKVIIDGDCNSNVIPLLVIAGLAIGAGSGGGSGSTSSN